MRTALFWVIAQRVVVISYRRFATTYESHLQGPRFLNPEDGTETPLYRIYFTVCNALKTKPKHPTSNNVKITA
jgi:hypothetical protein